MRKISQRIDHKQSVVHFSKGSQSSNKLINNPYLTADLLILTIFNNVLRNWVPSLLRLNQLVHTEVPPWGKEGGKYVPRLNFKTYRFAYWGRTLAHVGILLLYFCLPSSKFQSILCGLSRFHLPYVVILRPYCLFKFYPNSWQGLSIIA